MTTTTQTHALLVGGPADGRRLILNGTPPCFFVAERPLPSATPAQGATATMNYSSHEYRHSVTQSGESEAVYTHSSVKEVLAALIAGYRAEVKV